LGDLAQWGEEQGADAVPESDVGMSLLAWLSLILGRQSGEFGVL
jgi:hypothetical protein